MAQLGSVLRPFCGFFMVGLLAVLWIICGLVMVFGKDQRCEK